MEKPLPSSPPSMLNTHAFTYTHVLRSFALPPPEQTAQPAVPKEQTVAKARRCSTHARARTGDRGAHSAASRRTEAVHAPPSPPPGPSPMRAQASSSSHSKRGRSAAVAASRRACAWRVAGPGLQTTMHACRCKVLVVDACAHVYVWEYVRVRVCKYARLRARVYVH